jgi:hypothetical protein
LGRKDVDAVEIDPVILRLGKRYHLDALLDSRVTAVVTTADFPHGQEIRFDRYALTIRSCPQQLQQYSPEGFLTQQAFQDVRRCLKPSGQFVVYNYASRLDQQNFCIPPEVFGRASSSGCPHDP